MAHQLYVGVGLGALLSWIGLPGPGEAALIAAGLAASHGRLDLASVLVIGWTGAMTGGIAGWLVGRHGGRRLVLAGRSIRGRRLRALEHGNRFFERYGLIAVYFAPSWVAGINAMSTPRFLLANTVCSCAWVLLLGLGAYLVGPSIGDVAADVGAVGTVAIVTAAVVAVATARRRRARR